MGCRKKDMVKVIKFGNKTCLPSLPPSTLLLCPRKQAKPSWKTGFPPSKSCMISFTSFFGWNGIIKENEDREEFSVAGCCSLSLPTLLMLKMLKMLGMLPKKG